MVVGRMVFFLPLPILDAGRGYCIKLNINTRAERHSQTRTLAQNIIFFCSVFCWICANNNIPIRVRPRDPLSRMKYVSYISRNELVFFFFVLISNLAHIYPLCHRIFFCAAAARRTVYDFVYSLVQIVYRFYSVWPKLSGNM